MTEHYSEASCGKSLKSLWKWSAMAHGGERPKILRKPLLYPAELRDQRGILFLGTIRVLVFAHVTFSRVWHHGVALACQRRRRRRQAVPPKFRPMDRQLTATNMRAVSDGHPVASPSASLASVGRRRMVLAPRPGENAPAGHDCDHCDKNNPESDIGEHFVLRSGKSRRRCASSANAKDRYLSSIVFRVLPAGGTMAAFNSAERRHVRWQLNGKSTLR